MSDVNKPTGLSEFGVATPKEAFDLIETKLGEIKEQVREADEMGDGTDWGYRDGKSVHDCLTLLLESLKAVNNSLYEASEYIMLLTGEVGRQKALLSALSRRSPASEDETKH